MANATDVFDDDDVFAFANCLQSKEISVEKPKLRDTWWKLLDRLSGSVFTDEMLWWAQ